MAFKSEAHKAKMQELEKAGKVKAGTTAAWQKETPKGKLPERISPKKPKNLDDVLAMRKEKYGV